MKKKILWICLAIIFIIVIIIGIICFYKNRENNNFDVEKDNEINSNQYVDYIYNNNILTELGEFVATVAAEGDTMKYEIVEETLAITDNFSIKIPALKAIDGSDYMMVSEIIRNKIYNELVVYFADGNEVSIDNYTYEATLTRDQFVSIIISGNIFVETAAHPNNFCISINIDMLRNREVKLDDFVDNKEEFVKLVKSDEAIFSGVEEAKKYVKKELNKEELTAELFTNNKKAYFTEDGLAVVIEVPHEIGDYATFEIAYENIK